MSIPEKTLKEWRREALIGQTMDVTMYEGTAFCVASRYVKCQEYILQLTQELLDQVLIKEEKGKD